MRKISLNLPPKYRLEVKLTKSRDLLDETPLLPNMGEILRIKKGSRFSRFFRHIFEHAKIKKVVPAYFAIMIMTSSAIPAVSLHEVAASEVVTPHTTKTLIQFKTEAGVRYPVGSIKITTKYSFFHPGIDLDGITGDPIYPITPGKVSKIEYSRFAYGNAVYVDHGNGMSSLYAHLSKINVKEGDEVTHVTKLGEMGATGRSFGDHLHIEVYQDGKPVNPMTILPK